MKGEPNPPGGAPAAIVIHRNPLDPTDRVTRAAEPGRLLIDWLLEHYPAGFGRPVSILWNGRDCPIEHADRRLCAGDVIGIYAAPGDPVSATLGTLIVQALIAAAITIVATLAITLIFGKPKKPGTTPAADPVYSLSGASNSARLGEPVPVIYGQVITVPDWASAPYTYFENNNQFLAEILCVGQGIYQIDAVILGDTPVSSLGAPGAVTYQFFDPSQHLNSMGVIEAATGIMENVISAPEVADQELTGSLGGGTGTAIIESIVTATAPSSIKLNTIPIPATLPGSAFDLSDVVDIGGFNPNAGKLWNVSGYNPATGVITVAETTVVNDSRAVDQYVQFAAGGSSIVSGPFVVGKPGVRGNRIMVDFVFPSGLFKLSTSGKLTPRTVDLTILIQPIDDAGASAGSAIIKSETITRAANTPQRMTFSYDVPNGRYSVKVTRLTPAPSDTAVVDNFVWTGLKFRLLNATQPVYGHATLMAIKIRATNGISDGAASRVRVACRRLVPLLGVGSGVSRDPADAFVDVMTNPYYGARRPLGEVDLATIGALKSHWAGRAKFDGIFNSKTTVWDALVQIMQPAGAAPLPDGQKMSAVSDGRKALRTQFFSDANMAAGSFQLGYSFDKPGDYDGFRVEYRDPATFNAAYAIWPVGAADPDLVTLFGCTDATQAGQYARLLWQKRLRQRKTCQWETELEGLIPRFADRIAVASRLPRWGQTGVIAGVSGLAVRTDQPLDWSGADHVMMLRSDVGEPSAAIAVTRGTQDDEAILAADPGFAISPGWAEEPSHYTFGQAAEIVRDFTLTNLAHQGGVSTQLQAMIYDPETYTGTLPWLEEAL